MHFLFTAPRFHTNQHFAVKALIDAGHEVSFLALTKTRSEVYDALDPTILGTSALVNTGRLKLPPLLPYWTLMWKLKPEVVVVRDPNTGYGLLSIATARLMRRTTVFYSQTLMHRRLKWWERFIRMFPAWLARAKWITPLLGSPDSYPPAFDALRYVPFVMEPQTSPREKKWLREGTVRVLCIAKFMRRKNHHLIVQAIARLAERHNVRATIIGECVIEENFELLSEVQELAVSLGVEDLVDIKLNLPYWDVQREYTEHDLFVLPSRDEPAAVSPLEAMSHSLPVICSDSNGTQCYIRPDENGYVFRTDDLDHLVECIERIISDRSRLKEMGARSYDLVVSEHSPLRYVESMVSIANGEG